MPNKGLVTSYSKDFVDSQIVTSQNLERGRSPGVTEINLRAFFNNYNLETLITPLTLSS
jgi:hypothetical protein